MKPKWFNIENIPFGNMCCDDKYWLPLLLEGKKFKAYFLYNEKKEIIKYNIDVCEN